MNVGFLELIFTIYYDFLLEKLYIELNTKTYKIKKSILFSLFDENKKPVKEVFAADFSDRIVHHLLINRIIPYL
mgnify:CR=1 FL=1